MNATTIPLLSEEHRRLQALAGNWHGDEQLSETQWAKAGLATSEIIAEVEFGGLFVTQRYTQTRNGKTSFAAHSVFGFDRTDGLVKMFQFDSMGFVPAGPASGSWSGNELVLVRSSPRGDARLTYVLQSEDQYSHEIEFKPAGSDAWQTLLKGIYKRAPES